MSFSTDVKQELVRVRNRSAAAKKAQLAGLTHVAGTLILGRTLGIEFVTETHELGRHILSLASGIYDLRGELALRDMERRRHSLMTATLYGADCERLLTESGLLSRQSDGPELTQQIPSELLQDEDCKKAFLRGAFLGAGSCSDPKRALHLEIVCRSEAMAETICELIGEFGLNAKFVTRKGKPVVYLKEGDRIARLLTLLGAPIATLKFEDARAERELRNYLNRTNNCDTANIGKTVQAAMEQIEAIRLIEAKMGLHRLPPVLRETAELRLNHPEASLPELCAISGMSKSCIYHRLQRILRTAGELQ